ncbi:MAG TPA: exopolysaccharide transport family protein, partial [Rhizomicrobium sp.]
MPAAYAAPPAPPFAAGDFLRLVEKRKSLILRIMLGAFVLALLVAFILPTLYSTSAMVMLDQRKNNVTDLSAVLSQLPGDPATVQNEIQVLTSRDLAATVIARLKLYNDPEFNPALRQPGLIDFNLLLHPRTWFADSEVGDSGLRERDRIIDNFLKHLSAEAVGLSTTITITFTSRDAEKASRIANAVADAYVSNQIDTKVDATNNTNDWLTTRVHDLAQQIQIQEAAIQTYKAENNLNDTAPGNSLADQQMSGISAQIVQARSDLAEKQATYNRVMALVNAGNTADVSEVVASPLIVQLRTQEADLIRSESELSTKYGPLHPKMQAVEAQRRDLDEKIAQEVSRVAGSSANDLAIAKAHLASLQSSLGGAEHQSMTQNMARVKLQAMEANAGSTRTMYENFVSRLRGGQDQDQMQTPEGRVISRAPIPLSPASPKRALIVLASIPAGFLLGLLAALLAERLAPVPRPYPAKRARAPLSYIPAQPVPARLGPVGSWNGLPVLAEIPGSRSLRSIDHVIDWPQSAFSQAIAGLARQLESRGHGAGVVAVTAADDGESKAAIAVSLARAAAAMGKKVVLLDSDLRHPLAARAMRAPVTAGLLDVLARTAPLNIALAKDPRSNVMVLANSRKTSAPAAMLGS